MSTRLDMQESTQCSGEIEYPGVVYVVSFRGLLYKRSDHNRDQKNVICLFGLPLGKTTDDNVSVAFF